MKKVKQVFPSRNYITIDTQGDIEIVFNPVGDGTEGDDKLTFRRGRWAFRCNDFLAGKMLPNGENESMNRKIYSLNVVYDSENGEPIIDTTYVDPTSVIPLDGSLVTVGNLGTLATIAKQNEIKSAIQGMDLSALATIAKQNEIKSAIQGMDLSALATIAKQNEIKSVIEGINTHLKGVSDYFNSSGTLIIEGLPIGNYKYKGTAIINITTQEGTFTARVIGAVLDIMITKRNKEVFLRGYDTLYFTGSNNHEFFSIHGYLFTKDYLVRVGLPNSVEFDMYLNEQTKLTLRGNGNISIF